jgi:hypothetical protein
MNALIKLVCIIAIILGGSLALVLIVAMLTSSPSTLTHVPPETKQTSLNPAKYDELAAVVKACGKPTDNHPQQLNAGAGSIGRALVYRQYNTELWFYSGPESDKWMLMSAFPVNETNTIIVESANRRMPCMRGGLQDHFKAIAKLAAEMKKELGDLVKARKDYAGEVDTQLLEKGIESRTFTEGREAKTLVIQDVLAGRVRAQQLSNNSDLMARLRLLGFKKLKYNNGLSDEMFAGFVWDLTKKD